MRKIGKYVWAFLAMLAVVIVSGFATLGSVCHTGESMTYFAGKSAVFKFVDGEKTVESVYVNVGTIYEDVGQNCKIEVEYSNATTPSSSGIDFAPAYYMSNVYAQVGTDGWNYNWHTVASGKNISAKYLFFKADSNLELREIVALDKDGNVIELEPYDRSLDTAMKERAKAVDAQNAFRAEWAQSGSTRYNFTQDEAITMSAIHTLTAEKYNGFTYLTNGNFGILATAILSVPVTLFGGSTFALRLMPFLAGIASVILAFLWAKELFKSEKYAFYTSLLFVLGGVATTVSRIGGAYALVAAALLASAYFMYLFFSKGISANRPFQGGLNVTLSGVFASLAIVMETLAAVPVVAILVLFGFGVRRIFLSEKLALEKAEAQSDEQTGDEFDRNVLTAEKEKVRSIYGYKKRVAIGLAFLSFVAVPFLMLLGVGVAFYKPLVLVYDNVGDHTRSLISLIFANVFDAGRADYAGGVTAASSATVFSWLLPLKTTQIYAATVSGKAISWGVAINAGVSCLSLAAFVFVSYKVAYGFVQKTQDKFALRVRRIYFILLAAMAATMIAAGAKGVPTMLSATVFTMAYAAFLPLAAATVEQCACEKAKLASNLVLWVSAAAAVLFFALNVVTYYGIPV